MSAFTNKNRHKLIKSHNHALTQLKQKKKKEYKKLDKLYKKNPDEEPEDGGKAARQAINDQYMDLESAMLDANAKALEDFDASKTKEDEKEAKKLLEQTREMALNGNKATSGGGGNNNNNNNQGESKKMSRYEKRKQKKLAEEARLAEEREQLEEGLDNLKEIEIEKITNVLEPLGFKIKDIKADGHCLFTSIAHQLALRNNEEFNNKACFEMRKIATAHMKNNPNDFSPFVEGDFDEYCENMASTASWGGQIEIQALSDALRTPVEVYAADQPVLVMGELYGGANGSGLQPLRVTYHRKYYTLGEHYNSVVLM